MQRDGSIARILVPVDFSTGSESAWKAARRLAEALSAELILVHVLPTTPLEIEALYREEEEFAELRARQAAHQLGIPRRDEPPHHPQVFHGPFHGDTVREFSDAGRQWAALLEDWAAVGRETGAKARTTLRVGEPYREIVAAATEEDVDLVILATHGRGEIHRLLVGSVADKVIRMAPCPVMTVREVR